MARQEVKRKKKYFKEQTIVFEEWLGDARNKKPKEHVPPPEPVSRNPNRQEHPRGHRRSHRDVDLGSSPVTVPYQEHQHITAHAHLNTVDDFSDASSIFSSKSEDTVVHKAEPKPEERRKSSAYISLSKPPPPPQQYLSPPSTPQPRRKVKSETVTKVTTYKTKGSNDSLGRWVAVDTSSPRVSSEDVRYRSWTDGKQQTVRRSVIEKNPRVRVSETVESQGFVPTPQTAPYYQAGPGQVPFYPSEEKLNTLRVRSRSQSIGRRTKEHRVEQDFQKELYRAPKGRNASVPVPRRTERPDFYHPVNGQHHARVPLRKDSAAQPEGYSFCWVDGGQISDGYLSDCSSVRHVNTNAILGRSEITKTSAQRQEFSSTGSLTRSQTLPRGYKGPIFPKEAGETKVKTVRSVESTQSTFTTDENTRNRANFRPIDPSRSVQKERVVPTKATPVKGIVKYSDSTDGIVIKSRQQSSNSLKVTEFVTKERSLSEVKRFSRVSREDLAREETIDPVGLKEEESKKKQVKQKKKKKEKKSKTKKKESAEEKTEERKIREAEEKEKEKEKERERKRREKEHIVNEFKRLAKLDSEAEEHFTLRKSYSLPYRVKQKDSVTEEAIVVEKEVEVKAEESEEVQPESVPSIDELKKTNLSFDERIKEQRKILLDQISQKQDSGSGCNDTTHSLDLSGVTEAETVDGGWRRSSTASKQSNPPAIHISEGSNYKNKSSKYERREEVYRERFVPLNQQPPEIQGQPTGWEQFPAQKTKTQPVWVPERSSGDPVPVQPFVGGRQRKFSKGEESTRSKLQKHNQILQEKVSQQESHSVQSEAHFSKEYSESKQVREKNRRIDSRGSFESKDRHHLQYLEGNRQVRNHTERREQEGQSGWQRVEETKSTRKKFAEENIRQRRSDSSEWRKSESGAEPNRASVDKEKDKSELVRVYAKGNVIQLSLEHDEGEEFRRTHPRRETRSKGESSASEGDSSGALHAPRSSLRVKKNSDPILTSQSEESLSESEDSRDHVLFGAFLPYQNSTFKHPNGTVYKPKSIGEPVRDRQYAIMRRNEFEWSHGNEADALVASVTEQQVSLPEVVYYSICTHFFQPEYHDDVCNIHRRGKIVVPSGLDHVDTCIFYNHLYILEEEEVYVEKVVRQDEEVFVAQEDPTFEADNQMMFETSSTVSGSSHSSHRSHSLPRKHRNPFTSLKGEMMYNTLGGRSDSNNNDDEILNGLEKSFGSSYETLRHKKRSMNEEVMTTTPRYTPTSQFSTEKGADRNLSLSRPRLLRKSPDFPGVSRDIEDDYPKWRPKTPDAGDRNYGISLGLVR